MSNRLLCLLLSASLFAAGAVQAAGNTTIESFNKSKKILEHQVYQDHRITFYCLIFRSGQEHYAAGRLRDA